MEGPVPPGLRDAVERIPPSAPGASEVAKRMECASLLALWKSPTAPGDLRLHLCLPQATRWVAHPTPLPIRGPGSTRARGRRGRRPASFVHGGPGFTSARVPEQQRATRLLALPRPHTAPPKLRRYQMRPSRKIPKKVSVWRRCRKALAISPGEVPAWLVWVSPMRPAGRLPEPHEAGTTAR